MSTARQPTVSARIQLVGNFKPRGGGRNPTAFRFFDKVSVLCGIIFKFSVESSADVAQLVAHHLAKVRVASSSLVIRSEKPQGTIHLVAWPRGEAAACKAVHTGSNPVATSTTS